MDDEDVGRFWNENAEAWTALSRAGYDTYRDHLNTPAFFELLPDIRGYVQLLTSLVLVFGFAFEVPIATVLLVWTGMVTTEKLKSVRPYVFLGAFVIGMFLTPPDVISQTLLAVPVYLLYELGIIMSKLFAPKRASDEDPVTEGEQA